MSSFWRDTLRRSGVDPSELEEVKRGGARKVVREIMRLDDGTFAPKGQGRALRAGDRVKLPSGATRTVRQDGTVKAGGEAMQVAKPSRKAKKRMAASGATSKPQSDAAPKTTKKATSGTETSGTTEKSAKQHMSDFSAHLGSAEQHWSDSRKYGQAAAAAQKLIDSAEGLFDDEEAGAAAQKVIDNAEDVMQSSLDKEDEAADKAIASETAAYNSLAAAVAAGHEIDEDKFAKEIDHLDTAVRDQMYSAIALGRKERSNKVSESLWRSTLDRAGVDLSTPMWPDA